MKTFFKIATTAVVSVVLTFTATTAFYAIHRVRFVDSGSNTEALKYKLDIVNGYIDNNYLYDDIDYSKANDYAIKAYVASLEEPYTNYYTAKEFESYIGNIEESYVGIGVIISADTEQDKIEVISPIKGSPAYDAGIKSGDYIISVDGESFASNEMDACVSKIKSGPEGTTVKLEIDRNGQKIEYIVERREIVENSVSYKMLDSKIGYISISSFNTNSKNSDQSTYTEFVSAVEKLKADGMKSMIIDVRDNPGGVFEVVCAIADYLLPEGIITYTETKDGKRNEIKSDSREFNIPMAVLINGSSASASEILAGAMKDYDRADIIGTKSFGKGIVQQIFPFSDGSGMSMTISKYYTPNGISIHKVGVEPDISIELPDKYKDSYVSDIPQGYDTQLNKAIEILKNK